MAVRCERNRNVSVVTTALIGLFDLDLVTLHFAELSSRLDSHFMWPSGDCIDRFLAIGVNLLPRLRLTTRGNSVLRLIVASLIHWLSSHRRHPLACCYALWIRHLFSDCHYARACIRPSRASLSWHALILNKLHIRDFRCHRSSDLRLPLSKCIKMHLP